MNLKNFLPFDNFKLLTKLTPSEVNQRIESITELKKGLNFSFSTNRTKPYEGNLIDRSFEISRIISYRNSFLPVIKGHVSTYLGKTEVAIKMRPVVFVLIFMSLWLGIVGLICLGIITAAILHFKQLLEQGFSPGALVPFGIFAFGYALLTIAYKVESQKSKAFLTQLLEAEEV
ncbi:hypothetical protein [Segetibacter koreensis]|uniref:hypothetical protein n=1 Tax=Segetibacter koreensis TaxID=398037 RepID=UPI00036106FB|nr:hypothetical protein [Segetibacter koreensis]